MIDDKNAIPHAGKPAKLVSLNQKLLNITDPDELDAALSALTDKEFDQYKKAHEKSNGLIYINESFHYIKPWHRLYLWLFPLRTSIDFTKNVQSVIRYKIAFGHYFLLHESTRKYGKT